MTDLISREAAVNALPVLRQRYRQDCWKRWI